MKGHAQQAFGMPKDLASKNGLVQGRFVLSEDCSWGENYLFWYTVRWNNYNNYGTLTKLVTPNKFNLEQKLMELKVEGIKNVEVRNKILSSLESGNVHRVRMMVGEKLQYRYLWVDPIARTINVSSRWVSK
jgi:hypothetical protein